MNPKTRTTSSGKAKSASSGTVSKKKKRQLPIKIFIFTVIKIIVAFTLTFSLIAGGIGIGILYGYIKTASPITPEHLLLEEASFVYDKDGNEIARLKGTEFRIRTKHDEVPDNLRKAIVAIEDQRFYDHPGIDFIRISSAIISFVKNLGDAEHGGSTITQQLVKNLTGETQRSLKRKVQEWWRAIELEKKLSKDDILDIYMDVIYMGVKNGESIYGVQAASLAYFGKPVSELSLAECASIAGICNLPGKYAPISEKNKQNNKDRQEIILAKMLELGMITQKEYDQAISEELKFADNDNALIKEAGSQSNFVDQVFLDVVRDLQEKYNMSEREARFALTNHGYRVYTTQDSKVQQALEEVFMDEKYFAINDKKNLPHPLAAVAVVDAQTGEVRGLRGGYGEKKGALTFNHATQMRRPTGSSIKPIADYAPAIDLRLITAGTPIDDVPVYMDPINQKGKMYPKNYDGVYNGLTTVRYAIMRSINVVAAKVWMYNLGPDQSLAYLRRVGINLDKKEDGNLSLSLGGLRHGLSPLQMAAAYVPFVQNGIYFKPITYTRVEDRDGNIILENKPEMNIAYDEATAFIMTDMMKDVCRPGGTAYYYGPEDGEGILGQVKNKNGDLIPTAGKTGTTNEDYDRWFVGYTHYYSAAVWFGYEKNITVEVKGGYNPALRIWHAVMNKIHEDLEPVDIIDKPPNVVEKTICIDSGKIPTELCSQDPRKNRIRKEYFIRGTEPTEECDVHVKERVCVESRDIHGRNLLAGPYCPEELVEERVFIQRPEPYMPQNPKDPYPVDYKYEIPAGEYCNIHGAPAIPLPGLEDPSDREPSSSIDTGPDTGTGPNNQNGTIPNTSNGNGSGSNNGSSDGGANGNGRNNGDGNNRNNGSGNGRNNDNSNDDQDDDLFDFDLGFFEE